MTFPKARPRVVEDTVNQTRKVNTLERPGFRVAPWGTPGVTAWHLDSWFPAALARLENHPGR